MATTTTAGRGRGQTHTAAARQLVSPVAGQIIRIKPAMLRDSGAIDLLLRAGCRLQVVGS